MVVHDCREVHMRGWSGVLRQIVLSICAASAVQIGDARAQSAGTWSMKSSVPAALSEVAVAYVGGKVHVMGGSVLSVINPYHVVYDPAADRWSVGAPVPRALDHMGAAVLDGKIYLVGGFARNADRDAQNAAFEYDPALDTWRILAPMKAARGSVG